MFIACFFHILGAGEKSSPQETKGSVSFGANIANVRIPSQIRCNCNIGLFDVINSFKNCTL